ncbi:hypothetical protein GTW66_01545 [Streptomyces sp. SID5473]|nr:protein phosphatase [Streptomyces tsukubensis NRRL18488]MYS62856.1 hypothetical protein [Streptomyces sp. SID5473]
MYDGDYDKPRSAGRKWLTRSLGAALALAVVGGALYGGYRWTQTQYYVGTKDGHVALYQGIDQDLGWVSLSKVKKDHPEIELKYLPPYQQKQVEGTITQDSLGRAKAKISELSVQATACRKNEERREASAQAAARAAAAEKARKAAEGDSKTTEKPPTTASPAPGPTLSEEEQKLASNCGKQ